MKKDDVDSLCLIPRIFQNCEIEEIRKKLVKATRKLPLSVRERIMIVEYKVMQDSSKDSAIAAELQGRWNRPSIRFNDMKFPSDLNSSSIGMVETKHDERDLEGETD